jgi:hypothetical protein
MRMQVALVSDDDRRWIRNAVDAALELEGTLRVNIAGRVRGHYLAIAPGFAAFNLTAAKAAEKVIRDVMAVESAECGCTGADDGEFAFHDRPHEHVEGVPVSIRFDLNLPKVVGTCDACTGRSVTTSAST